MIGTFSFGIKRRGNIESFLGDRLTYLLIGSGYYPLCSIVGWANKANTARAIRYSKRHEIPYRRLEDGFLCYAMHPNLTRHSRPLSLVIDDDGIYYDATKESKLERLISEINLTQHERKRTRQCIDKIVKYNLSKYNHSSDSSIKLKNAKRVLVVDQTCGDLSIKYGLANKDSFREMLEAAKQENPDAEIIVKIHPDVITGKKAGHFASHDFKDVTLISHHVNPIALLKQVDKVYTVTSHMGFEALMVGKSVVCFGMPFYAGWGLTDDRTKCARRKKRRTLEEIFYAAYISYSLYINPDKGKRCEIEEVIDYLILQKTITEKKYENLYCVGMSLWKRAVIRPFLRSDAKNIEFIRSTRVLKRKYCENGNCAVLIWGYKNNKKAEAICNRLSLPLLRMEDGFIRSVGLGTDLVRPSSLVVDEGSLYYNYHKPSRLENMLNQGICDSSILERAKRLRQEIVNNRVTKYNQYSNHHLNLPISKTKRIILVIGQVEGDASLKYGGVDIFTDKELLQTVRAGNPDVFIFYKPHPDVLASNRKEGSVGMAPESVCDSVVGDIPITQCFSCVDEVHTITSLAGFEALLHGKEVHTYGMPFYAGWGLTYDRHENKNRTQRLTVDELVAATLIKYPRYVNWETGLYSTPEVIIDHLIVQRTHIKQETDHFKVPLIKSSWRMPGSRKSLKRLDSGIRRNDKIQLIQSFLNWINRCCRKVYNLTQTVVKSYNV